LKKGTLPFEVDQEKTQKTGGGRAHRETRRKRGMEGNRARVERLGKRNPKKKTHTFETGGESHETSLCWGRRSGKKLTLVKQPTRKKKIEKRPNHRKRLYQGGPAIYMIEGGKEDV